MYQVPCASEAVSEAADPRTVEEPPLVKTVRVQVTEVVELATITGYV